jgi:hypothetical protein
LKAGFHSSEGDDGVHLEVQVVVVGGGEDAEQRRRCWKQIGVAGSGNLTNTLRAMWKTVAWLAHTIEHLVHVLLSRLGGCILATVKPLALTLLASNST